MRYFLRKKVTPIYRYSIWDDNTLCQQLHISLDKKDHATCRSEEETFRNLRR